LNSAKRHHEVGSNKGSEKEVVKIKSIVNKDLKSHINSENQIVVAKQGSFSLRSIKTKTRKFVKLEGLTSLKSGGAGNNSFNDPGTLKSQGDSNLSRKKTNRDNF
jgi:hypothetical protein